MKGKKGFLQISFAWLFALIVGAFVLFLAIYSITKIISTENTAQDAKASKQIGDRKSTRLNSSHIPLSRMPSSA